MKNLVYVTSAINKFDANEFEVSHRFQETLKTCYSIKKYVPNVTIIMHELSPVPIDEFYFYVLEQLVDQIKISYDHYEYENNKLINYSGTKGEIIGSQIFYNDPYIREYCKKFNRIIKVSGRYYLTEKFNINNHVDPNKFTFKRKWWYEPGFLRDTRCWSMPVQYIDKYLAILPLALEKHETTNRDIEHLMAELLTDELVHEVDQIGVAGMTGSGYFIHD